MEDILKTIENLRDKLIKIAEDKQFTDPDVLAASHMLDAMLNEYQKLMKEKVNRS